MKIRVMQYSTSVMSLCELVTDKYCHCIAILFFLMGHEFTEDAYKIRIRIDDEPANLDILDTAGQVRE